MHLLLLLSLTIVHQGVQSRVRRLIKEQNLVVLLVAWYQQMIVQTKRVKKLVQKLESLID